MRLYPQLSTSLARTAALADIYLRHLAPVISLEQLGHEIDLSGVDLDYLNQ